MRYALISDIHSNYDALSAVLPAIEHAGVDVICCLGDIVGYGAEPGLCIDTLRQRNVLCILGNHDAAALGNFEIEYFNTDAQTSIYWTQARLTQEERDYLSQLPLTLTMDSFAAAHGAPKSPAAFEYVLSLEDAFLSFAALAERLMFVAHSHTPVNFMTDEESIWADMQTSYTLEENVRAIVNIGSVGQPRDGDARAAFCLYDSATGKIDLVRVPYDVDSAARKILDAQLPPINAHRLFLGR